MGIAGAGALIIASATFGICVASIVGNPVATALIRRFNLASPREMSAMGAVAVPDTSDVGPGEPRDVLTEAKNNEDVRHDSLTGNILLHNLLVLLAVMGVGALINAWHTWLGFILPNFTGPIVVAAVVRNVDDQYGWFKLNARAVEVLGAIALALFLAVALMDLKLWQLAELAVPMLTILSVQVVITVAYAVCGTFVLMGRDYEAAVAMTGHIGFGVGIASNAVANMEALIARYGPAPRSFVTVPVIALWSIDFLNPLIIVLFANLVR